MARFVKAVVGVVVALAAALSAPSVASAGQVEASPTASASWLGLLADRVGNHDEPSSLTPDGAVDGTFSLTVSFPGAHVLTSVSVNGDGIWDTVYNGNWVAGVTDPAAGAPLKNSSDTSVSVPFNDTLAVRLYLGDNASIAAGNRFTVTACLDGSTSTCGVTEVNTDTDGDQDDDGSPASTDCDDENANIHPGAVDWPGDEIDADCEGGDTTAYYTDADGDTYGNPYAMTPEETPPGAGYVTDNTDCDDGDANRFPGNTEIAGNEVDEDCDTYDGFAFYPDADGDGWGGTASVVASGPPEGYIERGGDCNDNDAAINPDATDTAGDGVDANCSGADSTTFYRDADGDLYGTPDVWFEDETGAPGYVDNKGDCNDANAAINPDAQDVAGNNIDENCDGSDAKTWYGDDDGDGYGNPNATASSNTAPGGFVADATDCNDANAAINPGAAEVPDNNVDENCDGHNAVTFFADSDGDAYGDPDETIVATVETEGYVFDNTDCDDTDSAVNPAATEVVDNGKDDDCDGAELRTWYADDDADGFGNPDVSATSNEQPEGGVLDSTDCGDGDASRHPGALETPDNNVDEDCDDFDLKTWYADDDADGYGYTLAKTMANLQPGHHVAVGGDCNDEAAAVHPGATEVADNGVDEDCDTFDLQTWYADDDADGFGNPHVSATSNEQPEGGVLDSTDCDDGDAGVNPAASEIADNDVDEDCDGDIDKTWYADADADSFGDPTSTEVASAAPEGHVADATDCDDTSNAVHPGATEVADNGTDEDCDGADLQTWYADDDADGFGNPDVSATSNEQPEGVVLDSTDCDDGDAGINPAAAEIADNDVDEDCDGDIDKTWYADADADSFGDPTSTEVASAAPEGHVADATDCDDTSNAVHPGASEVADNGTDEDCDDFDLTTWYADSDIDGYGNPAVTTTNNTMPTGYTSDNKDCDDADSNVNPGATEVTGNGKDDDCNPATSDAAATSPTTFGTVAKSNGYFNNKDNRVTISTKLSSPNAACTVGRVVTFTITGGSLSAPLVLTGTSNSSGVASVQTTLAPGTYNAALSTPATTACDAASSSAGSFVIAAVKPGKVK